MVTPGLKATVAHLKEVSILKCFSDAELEQILALGETKAFDPHANIVIEGELTYGLYIMLEGLCGIYKGNRGTNDTYDVGQLRAGGFFGEMSLIEDGSRSATVRSLTDAQVFFVGKEQFNQFVAQSAELKTRFLESTVKDLCGRLRELDENYVSAQVQLWKFALKKTKEAA